MNPTASTARSYLYVPGHRPDRFEKAMTCGADAVIFDLEDAVPVGAKDAARAAVGEFLTGRGRGEVQPWVRINDGDRGAEDLQALAGIEALCGVVVPKARRAVLAERRSLAAHVALLPLVESAAGLVEVAAIAAAEGTVTLAIGEVDLGADLALGDEPPEAARWALRMQVVVACAAAGRLAPLGPVVVEIDDVERFAAIARQLRAAGFGAMQAIHPKQVPVITKVFTPTTEEVAAAEALLRQADQADGGVFVGDDGRMIDEAVLRSARRIAGPGRPDGS